MTTPRPTKSTWSLRYAQANIHFIAGTFYAFLPGCNDPIASDIDIEEVLESCRASYLERLQEAERDAADDARYHAEMDECHCAASHNPNAECVCAEWEAMASK